jgi:hypothetical protein
VGLSEGTVAPDKNINFLRSAEPRINENTDSQFLIGGSRDARRLAWLMEEPDFRIEFDPLSFYTMYWALGSLSGNSLTIAPASTLPEITMWRNITDVMSSPAESGIATTKIYQSKVNSYELNFGKGEVATANIDFMGKGALLTNTSAAYTIDYTYEPMAFYDADVYIKSSRITGGTLLPEVGISIRIENNLTRRPTVSTTYGYRPYIIAEGGLDVSGRLTVGAMGLTLLGEVLDRAGDNTIEVRVNKTHGGNFTSTITMPQVLFTESPERLRGIEPYEVEIPFIALRTASNPAIKVIMSTITL